MQTRKQQLFSATKAAHKPNVIPATVKFVHDRKKGMIKPLSPQEKMLVALRKVLAAMSEKSPDGCRYFIAGNKVEITSPPATTEGKVGERQTYKASGRARLGVIHSAGHLTRMYISFSITYRDTEDDRGLADVEYIEPTTVDLIERGGPVNVAHLN